MDDLCNSDRDVRHENVVDSLVEDKPWYEGIDEEEPMAENKWTNESGYSNGTHNNVHHKVREAIKEHEENHRICYCGQIQERGFSTFEKSLRACQRHFHTLAYEIMQQAAVKDFHRKRQQATRPQDAQTLRVTEFH